MLIARQQLDRVLQYLYERKDVARAIDMEVIKKDVELLNMAGNKGELERMIIKIRDDKYLHLYPDYPRDEDGKQIMKEPMFTNISITFDGRLFWEDGGYTKQMANAAAEYNRLKAIANQTLMLTLILAAGTVPMGALAVADLYHKYQWFHSLYWWGMVGLLVCLPALISYLMYKWLERKQSKKPQ